MGWWSGLGGSIEPFVVIGTQSRRRPFMAGVGLQLLKCKVDIDVEV